MTLAEPSPRCSFRYTSIDEEAVEDRGLEDIDDVAVDAVRVVDVDRDAEPERRGDVLGRASL